MDGWITIGTKLSTDKFDKQISDLERKIDSEEQKQELLNEKTRDYERELRGVNEEARKLSEELDLASKKAKVSAEYLAKAKESNLRPLQVERFQQEYDADAKAVSELSEKLKETEKTQISLRNKVAQTRFQYENSLKSVEKLKGKVETINFKKQSDAVREIEKGISSSIKKVGKLALAVLSVRSAYSLLRRASSEWAQYNEQYAKDLEYIRFALTYGLAPILEKIVSLIATIMTYVNYLSNAWFGKIIFASAKDFEKMSKSAGSLAKSTNEIKNNLASFDELDILSKNATGGAGNGFVAPSFDLGDFEDVKIPKWIESLADNADKVKESLILIGSTIGALKLSAFASDLGLVATKLSLIKAVGIGVAIKGVVDGVEDLKQYSGDPSLENLGKTIADVGEAVVGVGVATGNLPIIAGGALVILTGKFIEHWDEIKDETQAGIDYLREKTPEIERLFGKTGEKIYTDVLDTSQEVLDTVDTTINAFNENVIAFIDIIDALARGDWTTAWNRFKDIFVNIWDSISAIFRTKINAILRFVNTFLQGVENQLNRLIDAINSLGGNISHVSIGQIPLLEKSDVVQMPTRAEMGLYGPEHMPSFTEDVVKFSESLSDKIGNIKQDITIKFDGTMSQLVRAIKPELDAESKRAGTKIITGGAY